jgi:hypothetical protein
VRIRTCSAQRYWWARVLGGGCDVCVASALVFKPKIYPMRSKRGVFVRGSFGLGFLWRWLAMYNITPYKGKSEQVCRLH